MELPDKSTPYVMLVSTCFYVSDEDVKKYLENLKKKKKSDPPLQVHEVDSCVPRTPERFGITLEDDPDGQYPALHKFKSSLLLQALYTNSR